jgi:hypothetical protein
MLAPGCMSSFNCMCNHQLLLVQIRNCHTSSLDHIWLERRSCRCLQVAVAAIIDIPSHLSCVSAQRRCSRKSLSWTITGLTWWLAGTRSNPPEACGQIRNCCASPGIDSVDRLTNISGDMGGPWAPSATVPSSANLGASWFWSRGVGMSATQCHHHQAEKKKVPCTTIPLVGQDGVLVNSGPEWAWAPPAKQWRAGVVYVLCLRERGSITNEENCNFTS